MENGFASWTIHMEQTYSEAHDNRLHIHDKPLSAHVFSLVPLQSGSNPSFHRTSRTKPRESNEFKRQAEEEQKEHL